MDDDDVAERQAPSSPAVKSSSSDEPVNGAAKPADDSSSTAPTKATEAEDEEDYDMFGSTPPPEPSKDVRLSDHPLPYLQILFVFSSFDCHEISMGNTSDLCCIG